MMLMPISLFHITMQCMQPRSQKRLGDLKISEPPPTKGKLSSDTPVWVDTGFLRLIKGVWMWMCVCLWGGVGVWMWMCVCLWGGVGVWMWVCGCLCVCTSPWQQLGIFFNLELILSVLAHNPHRCLMKMEEGETF